ncbi:uncharacterized protein LOC134005457 [Scomber scombrus]|uniref:uncharacterized protein LOC134005457 n=1 Tax=Scomber scombrus TaxID=13677 RepID=UPI002DD9D5A6|nr:uncharacterized protein LOC134005457 [Scomber scombrus]
MASPKVVFCLMCLSLGKIAQMTDLKFSSSVRQEKGFVSVNTGDSLTLQCFYEGDVARLYWYKQTLGQKPRLVSTFYKYERNGIFHDEFKNNPRFTLDTSLNKNQLKITDLQISDSATYYCASSYTFILEFEEGMIVSVKGSGFDIQALVHQSASESIQSGGSVTLNCTVHTGTCDDGEHSVYWFKNSEESHPGLIYTHGGRNNQTPTCVYNLPMKSLNLSHAGTYYCAVALCGHILFGDGTKLVVEREVDYFVLGNFWRGAFAVTTILVGVLGILVCVMNKRNLSPCDDAHRIISAASKRNAKDYQCGDNLHYFALMEIKINKARRQTDDTWSECVYFSVKQ